MRNVVYLVVVALSVALATGQQPAGDGRFVSAVEVRVVNVDVMVTDADGLPVTDLTPADFRLLEDGRPQRITNFYRIVHGAAQLDEAQLAAGLARDDERFRRRVLLVIDNNFLNAAERRRALDDVRTFVSERFDGDADWGVAAVGDRLEYLLPFTRDPFQVAASFDVIDELPANSSRLALDSALRNDPVRTGFMQDETSRSQTLDIGAQYRFRSREQAMRNLQAFATMADVLGGLMRSYAGFGGRKAVVLVTGKMEFHPEMQYLVSRDPKTWSDSGLTDRTQSDPAIEGAKKELEGVLDGLVRAANSTGFQLYTVAATGLTNPLRLNDVTNRQLGMVKDVGSFAAPPELSDHATAPLTLTRGTGGLSLTSNDLGESLGRAVDDTSTYYSLGYEPDHGPDRAYHSITVEVTRPGVKVRHREGYLDLTASELVAEELATPLAFPKPKGSLRVALAVEERERSGGTVRLHARVEVPVADLTMVPATGGGQRAEAEVFLAVYDENGNNLSVAQQRYPLAIPAGQEEAARAGFFRPTLAFTLEPGAYTVTVTVRDPVVGEHGTAVRQVLVGDRSS